MKKIYAVTLFKIISFLVKFIDYKHFNGIVIEKIIIPHNG